jgi:amino acid transporter
VLIAIILALNIKRGPDIFFSTEGYGTGQSYGFLGAFLVASLASLYVMYGFDTASSLGEESHNPRKNAPRSILRAIVASFIIGGLILLFALMSVTNINSPDIDTGGLQYIILDVLGETIGDIFLWCVVIAITVCCLAVHTAAIRMTFAMARDNNLPAGEHLARIDPRTKSPIIPAVVIGLLAFLILVVNINQPQIFVVITSIGIIMIYIAYLLVTAPMLLARIRGQWRSEDAPEGYFSLGRWGFAVNLAAVVWGLFMAINLAWPRQSVYNPVEPFHWYLKWGGVLFVGIVMLGGFAYYWFVQRHKTGTLAAHRIDEPAPVIAGGAVE